MRGRSAGVHCARVAPDLVTPDLVTLTCKDGNVTSYRILTSTDGGSFTEVRAGTWPADGRMQVATFGPTPARQVRFEIRAAHGSPAVTEVMVGGRP